MPIPVGRLAPGNQWDCNVLDRLFANDLYPTGLEFKRVEGFPNQSGCCLLVPGRYWYQNIDYINEAINRYRWLLLIKTSDEEDLFDVAKIQHENCKIWVQTPRTDRDYGDARLFGVGFPPHFNQLPAKPPPKTVGVFLSAQNTHSRRRECFAALKGFVGEDNLVFPTDGFTQGMTPGEYTAVMANARIAPCPSGAFSPDSFRVWEALEAHAVPIADDVSPAYDSRGYWWDVMGDVQFPVVRDYTGLPDLVHGCLAGHPANVNAIVAAWMRKKREYARWLVEDLQELGAV